VETNLEIKGDYVRLLKLVVADIEKEVLKKR